MLFPFIFATENLGKRAELILKILIDLIFIFTNMARPWKNIEVYFDAMHNTCTGIWSPNVNLFSIIWQEAKLKTHSENAKIWNFLSGKMFYQTRIRSPFFCPFVPSITAWRNDHQTIRVQSRVSICFVVVSKWSGTCNVDQLFIYQIN